MLKTCKLIIVIFLQFPFLSEAQTESKFLFDKPGRWIYANRISKPGSEYIAYGKNLKATAEWFHQHVPIMFNLKGFDLLAATYNSGSNYYQKRPCNYGLPCEMNFEFQLFYAKGGQWVVEPPAFEIDINNTETGHDSGSTWNGYDYREEDPTLEAQINKATGELNDLFVIFPFVKDLVPGVRLYGDGRLIAFNPDRPPFWIPVTVREVADRMLAYMSLKKDVLLLPRLKQEIAKLSEDEMNAHAYKGNAELFVLNVNGKQDGLQMMRFNPDYWDRSLPPSAIQFMTFWYPQLSEVEMDEYFKNNLHPHYGQLMMNSIKLEDLAGLIVRKK